MQTCSPRLSGISNTHRKPLGAALPPVVSEAAEFSILRIRGWRQQGGVACGTGRASIEVTLRFRPDLDCDKAAQLASREVGWAEVNAAVAAGKACLVRGGGEGVPSEGYRMRWVIPGSIFELPAARTTDWPK
jgi:hypothetical protein